MGDKMSYGELVAYVRELERQRDTLAAEVHASIIETTVLKRKRRAALEAYDAVRKKRRADQKALSAAYKELHRLTGR